MGRNWREFFSSLVLLVLIVICWSVLSGRALDTTRVGFVYKDF